MSDVRLTKRSLAAASALLVVSLSVTVGVADGVLPGSWRPYFWVAWPVSLALALVYAKTEALRAEAEEPQQARGTVAGRSRARARLLERVQRSWITEVLERSLYQEARLELGLEKTADEPHPWGMVSAAASGPREPVLPGTPVSDIFNELDQAMVVLGAPGSGKTTVMLELLREMLTRSRAGSDTRMPVVLPLASWALRPKPQPLADWIVQEVAEKHHIETRHVQAWLDDGQLALLLDGLDEVAADRREDCVRAVNEFRAAHGTAPLAVSCRTADYRQFSTALNVYGTLTVLPLSRQQVERFLDRPDRRFAGAQAALAAQPELWELASTPLMLSIMILAFREPGSLGDLSGGSRQGLLRRLFEEYVRSMLASRRAHGRERGQLIRQLAFLARQLQRDEQTVFSPDLINPISLPSRFWATLLAGGSSLLWASSGVAAMGGVAGAVYGWDGAVVGGIGGLLATLVSRLCINSYSLAAREWSEKLRESKEPVGVLSSLMNRLTDAEKLSLFYTLVAVASRELSEGLVKGGLSAEELAFFKEAPARLSAAKPRRIMRALRDPRFIDPVQRMSSDEKSALAQILGATLIHELSDGSLSGKLLPDELSSAKEEILSAAKEIPETWSPAPELLPPEPDQELVHIMQRPSRGWGTRVLQQGARFMLWSYRLHWYLEDSHPLVGELLSNSKAAVIVVVAGVPAGLLLGWSYLPATIAGGLAALVALMVATRFVERRPRRHLGWGFPSPGVRATIRGGLLAAPAAGFVAGTTAGVALSLELGSNAGLRFSAVVGGCVAFFALGCFGGYALLEQTRIRLVLHWATLLPIRARPFLDYGVRCLFLRQSGETYLFAHRTLQEFFAALCPADTNEPDSRLLQVLTSESPLAEQGDPRSQYEMGVLLEEGMDPPDLDGARSWYTRAAETGYVPAQFALGLLFQTLLDPPDLDSARNWYTRAAEAGDTRAQFNLGVLLEEEMDPPDLDSARQWYARAAEAGDVDAQFALGSLLGAELDPPDLAGARKWYTQAALAGHVHAAVELGLLLAGGLDPPDLEGARTWLTTAAGAGDAEAQFLLGVLANEEDPPDEVSTRAWWSRAARAGHSEAAFELGRFLEQRVDPPDRNGALKYYWRAAEAGHTDAQLRLGALFLEPGFLDVARARFWLTEAAEAGDTDAQFFLGSLLRLGDPPDLDGARSWYTRAAECDHTDAQFNLAIMLQQLRPPDLPAARTWLLRAAQAGHAQAREELRRLG
jgi:TPR repeat protein